MDRPELRIKAMFNEETGEFGGMLVLPNGVNSPITGRLPESVRQAIQFNRSRRKPRGAPKRIGAHLARLMHVLMAMQYYQEGLNAARLRVANLLSLGNSEQPDNVRRQMIVSTKNADNFLKNWGAGDVIIFHPDDGMPISFIFKEKTRPQLQTDENGLQYLIADGDAWLCHWGDRDAKYGRLGVRSTFNGSPTAEGLAYLGKGDNNP